MVWSKENIMAIILASKSPRRQELMRERFEQMIAYAANEQECRSAVHPQRAIRANIHAVR